MTSQKCREVKKSTGSNCSGCHYEKVVTKTRRFPRTFPSFLYLKVLCQKFFCEKFPVLSMLSLLPHVTVSQVHLWLLPGHWFSIEWILLHIINEPMFQAHASQAQVPLLHLLSQYEPHPEFVDRCLCALNKNTQDTPDSPCLSVKL